MVYNYVNDSYMYIPKRGGSWHSCEYWYIVVSQRAMCTCIQNGTLSILDSIGPWA